MESRLKTIPVLDKHEYPQSWNEYIGQTAAVTMLKVAAKSARIRNEPLDHVLIQHPTPGIGKTALAALISTELGTTCRVASGPMSADKARILFSEMQDRDVLFYDEYHQIFDAGKKQAEWQLTYLQDGYIYGPYGPEEQPKVTIVAATTEAIPKNIRTRFPLTPVIKDYTGDEAVKIAMVLAGKVLKDFPKLGKADAAAIASAAHNNPRAIRQLLVVLRDMVITDTLPLQDGHYDIAGLLELSGITADGLGPVAQQYLLSLATEFDGSAGAKALEDRLQQPGGGLAEVERMLMDKGLIAKTHTGRTLTQAGIRRFRELAS